MGAETNPISPDPKIRAAAVAHLDRVMECGQAFGCEILCGPTHSAIGVFSGEGPTEDEFKQGVETLQRAAEKAQARGMKIAVEYLNRFEIYFLTTAAQTARFVRAVNHPSCKMMYDSFHAHIEEKDQAKAIASCAAETIHVHVSENDRGVPGTGQVDWDSFFGGLKASNYNGYLTIEAFGRALPALAAATKVWRDLFPDAWRFAAMDWLSSSRAAERPPPNLSLNGAVFITESLGETSRPEIAMNVFARIAASALAGLCLIPLVLAQEPAPAQTKAGAAPAKAQARPHGQRVKVDPAIVAVEDGDTVVIRWPGAEAEIVRILGIDTPETRQARAQPALRPAVRQGGERFRPRGIRSRKRGRAAQLPDPRPIRSNPRLSLSSMAAISR